VWGLARFPNQNLIAAHNTIRQVMAISSEHVEIYLVNPTVMCPVGSGSVGVHASSSYVTSFTIEQGQIAGCARGVSGGGGGRGMTLTGTVLQNEINVDDLGVAAVLFENVMHLPLANYPHQYILFGDGAVWSGRDPIPPAGGLSVWIPARGSRLVAKNWQGTGKDYLLFFRQSLGSNPAWSSAPQGGHLFNTPAQGLTMQQSWDTYGLSFGGDVLQESEAVHLDGLVNGLAREGLGVHYGPPRAVVTFPTMRATARLDGNVIRIFALLTGDPDAASPVMMYSVDDDRPQAVEKSGSYLDDRSFATAHTAPGVHTVKVWRTRKDDRSKAVPGSEFTSQYCIGPCPTIPHGRIGLSTVGLTFRAGEATAQTFALSNSGAVNLNWAAGTSPAWCRLDRYNGWLGVGESATLKVLVNPPPKAGSAVCTVTISDNNADNSPQTITVNYTVDQ
jgi:hypothetical protein